MQSNTYGNSKQRAYDETGFYDPNEWPQPAPIAPASAQRLPYPTWPDSLSHILDAVCLMSGCSRPLAAVTLMGSLSLLASHDVTVETLAPSPSPTSLFMLGIAESGWRKSEAFNLLFHPHIDADRALASRYEKAKEDHNEWRARSSKRNGPNADVVEPPRPKTRCPRALRHDDTIETTVQRLLTARPTISMALDEAVKLTGNFSFISSQLPRTLGVLCTLWTGGVIGESRMTDDREIYLYPGDYNFSLCWLGQAGVLSPVILSSTAANGFAARALVSWDTERPEEQLPTDDVLKSCQGVIDRYRQDILQWRGRQDAEMEYQMEYQGGDPLVKQLIPLDPGAKLALATFNRDMEDRADRLMAERRTAEQGFACRAAEQAARVAACWSAWESKGRQPIEEPMMDMAIAVVEWHAQELARMVTDGGLEEITDAARAASDFLVDAAKDPERYKKNGKPLVEDGSARANTRLSVLSLLALHGPRRALRRDPGLRKEVLEVLIREHHIRPAGHGKFLLNPGLHAG